MNAKELATAVDGLNRSAVTFMQLGADLHALAFLIESQATAADADGLRRVRALLSTGRQHLELLEPGLEAVIAHFESEPTGDPSRE